MKPLTRRQMEVLSFLASYITEHGYPPSIREIAAFFAISVKGAYDHIKALERKGKVRVGSNRSRALEIVENEPATTRVEMLEVPILGRVAAGVPLLAAENLVGSMKLPADELRDGEYFVLSVQGDSMIGAGILDGDLAVIRRQQVADNGAIIVAMLDDAVTLKRFYREPTRVQLRAENPAYPPIYTREAQIVGCLARIVRRYE